ncbi:MAG TPA: divalent metal cation transporter [Thermoanaerobaculia bacterium]|nr:divalent metal cation transporter [Thermoanaerobaculia bacterium]
MRRLGSILLWSVIAAAFLGPGTVTACASAGAAHGTTLLWALAFSTVATLVLQEAAARLAVVSGRDLAQVLAERSRGLGVAVVGTVVLGCAAYQAGNILGGVAGASLAVPAPAWLLTLVVAAVAALLLALGNPRTVARSLSVLVALMGVAFLATAVLLRPAAGEVLRGALVPALPPGSGLLVLGLVGTTVVPYNLFLGSGLAAGQTLAELRFGLSVAVLLGGVISMGVLVAGTALPAGELDFAALAAVLGDRLGTWAAPLFAAGLAAAGLTSAVTAPLAAALAVRGAVRGRRGAEAGGAKAASGEAGSGRAGAAAPGRLFHAAWAAVLAVGVVFGVSGVRPVPVILLAQALNGVLLPGVAVFLLLAVNDRRLMGAEGLNGRLANAVTGAVVAVTLVLGMRGLAGAAAAAAGWQAPGEGVLLGLAAAAGAMLLVPVVRCAARLR